MKKRFLVLMLIVSLVAMTFAACGGGGGDADQGGAAEETSDEVFTMKWAHSSPADNDRLPDASVQIIKEIEEESNGRLIFEHYPASQLGAEREQLEGVQMGTIDVCVVSTGPIPGLFPEIAVCAIPYLITDRDTAYAVYDGVFGQTLAKKMEEKTGMKIFGWAENGFRTFSNNKRPVATPADMKGLKIRVMENPVHMKLVEDLGASAIPVTFAELYTALSQGTVDGQENGLTLTYTNKLYEALKYITDDNHIYDVYCLAMAADSYNKLPKDLQQLLDKKMRDFIDLERQMNLDYEQSSVQKMKDAGIEFTYLTDEQRQMFKDATANIVDMARKDAGDELVDLFLSEIEKAQK